MTAFGQHPNSTIRKGNTVYKDSAYANAEKLYREALMKKQNSYEASFNLADAIYKQERYNEANAMFQAITEKTNDKIKKSASFHNLGNSLLKEQKLDQAIEAYKNALRNNPKDLDSKHNLAYAMRMKNQSQNQEEEKKEEEEEKNEEEVYMCFLFPLKTKKKKKRKKSKKKNKKIKRKTKKIKASNPKKRKKKSQSNLKTPMK
ncbi:CDC27 family protein [Flavobacteriales bacterium]|nr:CDC27 family protein [Flavobacteriales bacterium]